MRRITLITILSASLMVVSACSSTKEPELAKLSPVKNEAKVKRVWEAQSGNGNDGQFLVLTPAVTYDRIFTVAENGDVTAINAFDGKTLWRTDVDKGITAGPTLGDGKVYVPTTEGGLVALDAKTGKEVWQVDLPNQSYARPNYSDNKVLVKTIDDKVVALSSKDGKQQWLYDDNAPAMVLQGGSQPIIDGNTVINGFSDGKLVLLSLNDGKMIWEKQIAESDGISKTTQMVDISGDPMIKDGVIYVVTYQGNISALDETSGEVLWSHDVSSYTGLDVSDKYVFVADAKGYLWAFDRNSGQVMWRQEKLLDRGLTKPTVVGDYVTVADKEGFVHWLSQDEGKFVARNFTNEDGIITPPVANGNKLFVVANDGETDAYAI